MIQAVPDGVREITPTIAPVRERGDRRQREKPFPRVGDEEDEEEEEVPTPSGSHDEPVAPPRRDEDHDGKIDIRVSGRLLPTRQILPSLPRASVLH